MRDWLDAREAIDFGRDLARDIDQLFPVTPEQRKTISSIKGQKRLDSVLRRTRAFAQHHKLNIYKKAKLLNTLKWELRDSGHDDALIDEVVALLTPLLT